MSRLYEDAARKGSVILHNLEEVQVGGVFYIFLLVWLDQWFLLCFQYGFMHNRRRQEDRNKKAVRWKNVIIALLY